MDNTKLDMLFDIWIGVVIGFSVLIFILCVGQWLSHRCSHYWKFIRMWGGGLMEYECKKCGKIKHTQYEQINNIDNEQNG